MADSIATLQRRVQDKTRTLQVAQRENRRLLSRVRSLEKREYDLCLERNRLKYRLDRISTITKPSLDTCQKALAALAKQNRIMEELLENKGYEYDYRTGLWYFGELRPANRD